MPALWSWEHVGKHLKDLAPIANSVENPSIIPCTMHRQQSPDAIICPVMFLSRYACSEADPRRARGPGLCYQGSDSKSRQGVKGSSVEADGTMFGQSPPGTSKIGLELTDGNPFRAKATSFQIIP